MTRGSGRAFFLDADRALSARRVSINKFYEFQPPELTTVFGRGLARWDGIRVAYRKVKGEAAPQGLSGPR
jgi:hypothetical protein